MDLDANLHVVRADAAAESLRSLVKRELYLTPTAATCSAPHVSLWASPSEQSERVSELIFGEVVDVYENADGWSWVQSREDNYVGYARSEALRGGADDATHFVVRPWALVHATLNLSEAPLIALPFGARVVVIEEDMSKRPSNPSVPCVRVEGLGWMPASAVSPTPLRERPTGALATIFLGSPYLWGGRTALGIDCSALVQTCLRARGYPAPRDVYMQRAWIGLADVDLVSPDCLQADDVLLMKGHVALCIGDGHCVHACGQSMHVRRESVVALLSARGLHWRDITVRRLP